MTTVRDAATTFLEGLFVAAGLTARVDSTIEGDEIEVMVHGDELTMFVGPRGSTLTTLQDVTRVVSQRRLGDHDTRLRLDVGATASVARMHSVVSPRKLPTTCSNRARRASSSR